MPIIGATQLEPVNILGSYVQGMELGRANRLARQQEAAAMAQAQREAEMRNYLATADLSTPEAQNQLLRFGEPGAKMAQSLATIGRERTQQENTQLEIAGRKIKRQRDLLAPVSDQAGWTAWRNSTLDAYGDVPEMAQVIPEQYSPAAKQQLLLSADDIVSRLPMSPEKFAQEQELRRTGASRTVVQMPAAETERSKTVGKLGGEALVNEFNAVSSASRGLARDYETLDLLRKGKPATGITSELETNIARFRSSVGKDPESIKTASDSQLLEALLGQQVFEQIQSLGVGARGLDTPAEREFLREVIAGTRKLDKQTLIQMAEMRAKYKEDLVNDYNARIESGELDQFFSDFGKPKRAFKVPQRPAEPAAPKTFATEAQAEAAFKAGKLKAGDRVTIGGVSGTWK